MTLKIENINLAFHNMFLKQATHMPKCKVVWIFHAPIKKGTFSTFWNNSTFIAT
jgi:hypothetical protein